MNLDNLSEHELIVIITTTGNREDAKKLGKGLVKKQLAACVQLSEIESIYTWQGKMEEDGEIRLMIKLVPQKFDEVVNYLELHHPYDTPEIISTRFHSEESYLNWCQSVSGL